jgi:endonuclease III
MDKKTAIKQFKDIQKYSKKTNMRLAAEGWDSDWKTLIAILMSAQTRDETTIIIAEKLFKKFNTIKKIANAEISEIEKTIKSINYYKTKSKNIKSCAKEILKKGLTDNFEELIKLPGVGRKTANVFLTEYNKIKAIAVDTHVFRISRKMKWAKENNPEKVEKELNQLFPKRIWNQINPTLVRFGKAYGTNRKKEDDILEAIKKIKD